jgi:CrcB protein
MSLWLAVALGGSLGAVVRVACANWEIGKFPAGIFAVNIIGCFLIGLVTGWIRVHDWPAPWLRAFIISGVLGALTTFSTFAMQAVDLSRKKEWSISMTYVFASVVLGICLAWLGLQCGSIGAADSHPPV